MAGRAIAAGVLVLLTLTAAAHAQGPAPTPAPTADPQPWPYPPPDPKDWWEGKWPAAPEAADPLAGRRLARRERPAAIDNGVDATLYRLWGLPPLQWQALRGDEMILEVWTRPAQSVRQTVTRVTVRRDGRVFVQGRAGLACCEAGIARRVGFDAEAETGSAERFLALRGDPMWDSPREVMVAEAGGAADALCVDGVSYDLTLVVPGRARSLRRACDNAEIGQVAAAVEPALQAALGHEPRFDALFPRGADFADARRAYQGLIADGGGLKPAPASRAQAPGFAPEPDLYESDAAATPPADAAP